MKKIELFWNIVFWGIYKLDVYIWHLFGYLNPFKLFRKIKNVRKYYSEYDVNEIDNLRNLLFNNKNSGLSITHSYGKIGGLLVLLEFGLLNIILGVINLYEYVYNKIFEDILLLLIYLIILLATTIVINNYLLFTKNKYLVYFEEFEKKPKSKRDLYFIISLITILLIILLFFVSFLLPHSTQ